MDIPARLNTVGQEFPIWGLRFDKTLAFCADGVWEKILMMKTIQIYDRPMCCSTGICGPTVDPVLPRFAADLDKLKNAGHPVERYNLSQQPQAFIDNREIHSLISTKGTDVLPVVLVDGHVVSRGIYPSLELLQMWAGESTAPASISVSLPIADQGCCSGSTGCC